MKRGEDPRKVYRAGETPPELAEMLLEELDRESAEYEAMERKRKSAIGEGVDP